jgi:crotonobetainyl-CoA:carnitine CoA-transferase CaiB-like acyl-CoA transferase
VLDEDDEERVEHPGLPPPLLGEHGDAILTEAGMDDETIGRLRARGVLR